MKTVTNTGSCFGPPFFFQYVCVCNHSLSHWFMEQSLLECSIFSKDSLKFGGDHKEILLRT